MMVDNPTNRMIDYCFDCSKKREVKKTGEYIYEGNLLDIVVCQWCRAEETKRKRHNTKLSGAVFASAGMINHQAHNKLIHQTSW